MLSKSTDGRDHDRPEKNSVQQVAHFRYTLLETPVDTVATTVHTVTHRHRDIDIIGTSKITLLKLNALPILLYFAHLEVWSTSSISIVSKSGR